MNRFTSIVSIECNATLLSQLLFFFLFPFTLSSTRKCSKTPAFFNFPVYQFKGWVRKQKLVVLRIFNPRKLCCLSSLVLLTFLLRFLVPLLGLVKLVKQQQQQIQHTNCVSPPKVPLALLPLSSFSSQDDVFNGPTGEACALERRSCKVQQGGLQEVTKWTPQFKRRPEIASFTRYWYLVVFSNKPDQPPLSHALLSLSHALSHTQTLFSESPPYSSGLFSFFHSDFLNYKRLNLFLSVALSSRKNLEREREREREKRKRNESEASVHKQSFFFWSKKQVEQRAIDR